MRIPIYVAEGRLDPAHGTSPRDNVAKADDAARALNRLGLTGAEVAAHALKRQGQANRTRARFALNEARAGLESAGPQALPSPDGRPAIDGRLAALHAQVQPMFDILPPAIQEQVLPEFQGEHDRMVTISARATMEGVARWVEQGASAELGRSAERLLSDPDRIDEALAKQTRLINDTPVPRDMHDRLTAQASMRLSEARIDGLIATDRDGEALALAGPDIETVRFRIDRREALGARAAAEERIAVDTLIAEDRAAIEAGGEGLPAAHFGEAQVRTALGDDGVAAWQSSRRIARQTFLATTGLEQVPEAEFASRRAAIKEPAVQAAFDARASDLIEARRRDPAAAVGSFATVRAAESALQFTGEGQARQPTPESLQALIRARIAAQRALGIAEPQPVTVEEGLEIAERLRQASERGGSAAAVLGWVQRLYGSFTPSALTAVQRAAEIDRQAGRNIRAMVSVPSTASSDGIATDELPWIPQTATGEEASAQSDAQTRPGGDEEAAPAQQPDSEPDPALADQQDEDAAPLEMRSPRLPAPPQSRPQGMPDRPAEPSPEQTAPSVTPPARIETPEQLREALRSPLAPQAPANFEGLRELPLDQAVAEYQQLASAEDPLGRVPVLKISARRFDATADGVTARVGLVSRDELTRPGGCVLYRPIQALTGQIAADVRADPRGFSGARFGTEVHTRLKHEINDRMAGGLSAERLRAEISAIKSRFGDAGYGERGSIRVDVLHWQRSGPLCAFDIKTENARDLTSDRSMEIAIAAWRIFRYEGEIVVATIRPPVNRP